MSDRTVHTDALSTLGSIIGSDAGRDAIHLAVEPVIAAERLTPGQDIGLTPDGTASAHVIGKLGIVDPFITRLVQPGERFWLVVYPRKITSLRHVWEHPSFKPSEPPPPPVDKVSQLADARAVIQAQADSHGISFDEMMDAAKRFAEAGEYMVQGGRWEGEGIHGEDAEKFWNAYEAVSGETVEESDRGYIFSCSC